MSETPASTTLARWLFDDGLGEGAIAGLDLGEVLPDGDARAVEASWARSGRGAMLAASLDDQEQGFGELAARAVGAVVDPGDDLFDEGCEEWSEAGLFVEGP